VVIDPRRSETARRAALHLQPRPGTDSLIVAAMIKVMLDEGLIDDSFVAEEVSGIEQLRMALEGISPGVVAELADVSVDDLVQAARMFANATFAVGLVGTGPTWPSRERCLSISSW